MKNALRDFKAFVLKGDVVALAVAVNMSSSDAIGAGAPPTCWGSAGTDGLGTGSRPTLYALRGSPRPILGHRPAPALPDSGRPLGDRRERPALRLRGLRASGPAAAASRGERLPVSGGIVGRPRDQLPLGRDVVTLP